MSEFREWWDEWGVLIVAGVVVLGWLLVAVALSASSAKLRAECLSSGVVTEIGVTKEYRGRDTPWALVTRPDGSLCVALGVTARELFDANKQ